MTDGVLARLAALAGRSRGDRELVEQAAHVGLGGLGRGGARVTGNQEQDRDQGEGKAWGHGCSEWPRTAG